MNIQHFHSALSAELELTQKYIVTFSKSEDKIVDMAVQHIVGNRGKMLRPMLLILTGRCLHLDKNPDGSGEQELIEQLAKSAAILELIQMSSLIHDDVLDYSSHRRGKATLNNLRGNRFAILVGDYLIAQSIKNCYALVRRSSRLFDTKIMFSFLDSISKLVLGEVQQNNFNYDISEEKDGIKNYFQIVENKTASLFSLACSVGSTIGDKDSENIEKFKEFGRNIGISYQIIDDLRDYAFDKAIAGEKNFQDIIYGIKTLPLIHAGNNASAEEQEILNKVYNSKKEVPEADKLEVLDILIRNGSIEHAYNEAKSHFDKAREILSQLPNNKFSNLISEMLENFSSHGERVVEHVISVKV
ncbi:MAG: polyprenyl synthetase family protein [Bacteroidota bacterium]|jgi:geranylgeranyl pyrophosphate synthase